MLSENVKNWTLLAYKLISGAIVPIMRVRGAIVAMGILRACRLPDGAQRAMI